MNHVVPEQPVMLALVVCPIYMAARSGYAIVPDLAATDHIKYGRGIIVA